MIRSCLAAHTLWVGSIVTCLCVQLNVIIIYVVELGVNYVDGVSVGRAGAPQGSARRTRVRSAGLRVAGRTVEDHGRPVTVCSSLKLPPRSSLSHTDPVHVSILLRHCHNNITV